MDWSWIFISSIGMTIEIELDNTSANRICKKTKLNWKPTGTYRRMTGSIALHCAMIRIEIVINFYLRNLGRIAIARYKRARELEFFSDSLESKLVSCIVSVLKCLRLSSDPVTLKLRRGKWESSIKHARNLQNFTMVYQ
jgi:hypothetical protein